MPPRKKLSSQHKTAISRSLKGKKRKKRPSRGANRRQPQAVDDYPTALRKMAARLAKRSVRKA